MKTLILTIATNGYGEFLRDHIASQEAYAARHGYRHVALTKTPPGGISAANSSWLKIPMMLRSMTCGYDRVFFLDADAMVMEQAPALEAMQVPGKTVYMARESTGRYNAGVIMCLTSPAAMSFLKHIYRLADWPGSWLPASDRNLYENGHVIHAARSHQTSIHTIDPRWNYTYDTTLPDPSDYFVLHGRDSWNLKPRSRQQPVPRWRTYARRIAQGPRTFLLWRLCRWYVRQYSAAWPSRPEAVPSGTPASPRDESGG